MKDKQFNPLDPFNWLAPNASGSTVTPNNRTLDEIYADVLKVKKLHRKIAKLEYKAGFLEFRNGYVEAAGKHLTRAIELDPTIKHKYKFNGETLLLADQKTADKVFAKKDVTINGIFDSKTLKPVDKKTVLGSEPKVKAWSNTDVIDFEKLFKDNFGTIKATAEKPREKSKFEKQLEAALALKDKKIKANVNVGLGKVTSPTEVSPLKSSRPAKKNYKGIDVPERDSIFIDTFRTVDADDLFNVGLNDSFEQLLLEIEAMTNALNKKDVSKNFTTPVNKEATRKQVNGIRKILTADEHDVVTKDLIKAMPNRKHAQMLNSSFFGANDKRIVLTAEDIKELLDILNS